MTTVEDRVRAQLEQLNPGERRLAEIRLERILRRKKAVQEFPSPGHLAKFTNPDLRQTQMMVALDKAIIEADSGVARRWLISTPPQEGKTLRIGTSAALWLLLRDPSRRIVVASYEQGIAARSTLAVRQQIETYGGGYKGDNTRRSQEDHLGLLLDPDRAQQTNWQLADVPGRVNGGLTAVGVGSAFTGRSADVLIIDDAVKDAKAADSPQQRRVMKDWFRAVATTRLAGYAIVIVVGTRWHEDDLMGWLQREDDAEPTPQWSRLTIRAQAEGDDPLGRKPGEYLQSAREGRDWARIRRNVGERWWAALYQARPAPPSGGVFKLEWIERNRVNAAPELTRTGVWVDPADNEGEGDEAGVIVAGKGYNEDFYILADRSSHMTSGRWLRVAFLAGLEYGASEINYEQSLSGLKRQTRLVWKDMLREGRKLHALWHPFHGERYPLAPPPELLADAVVALARDDADAVERANLETNLIELWPLVPIMMDLPSAGLPVRSFPAKGSKTFRAKIVSPLYSGDHVHHVGHFPEYEHQLCSWMESRKSPDRMDTGVHALTQLSKAGGPVSIQRPTGVSIPKIGITEQPYGNRRPTRRW